MERGEIVQLGRHRLMCGDCRDAESLAVLLGATKANVVITSPPYASQRKYDPASGFRPIKPDAYVEWYRPVAESLAAYLALDGSYFLNIKEHCEDGQRSLYVKDLTLAHARTWGWRFVDELCWIKPGFPGDNRGRFKNAWEPIFHFTRNKGHKHRPDAVSHVSDKAIVYAPERRESLARVGWTRKELKQYAVGLARPSNVLRFSSGKTPGTMRHSAAFPVDLAVFFLKGFSDTGDVVYDPFMGSGTTLIAAEKTNRISYGCEISAEYCQVIIDRYHALTRQPKLPLTA